jgi:hypothetical protein
MNILNKILNLWYYFLNYDNNIINKYDDKYNKLDEICDIIAES